MKIPEINPEESITLATEFTKDIGFPIQENDMMRLASIMIIVPEIINSGCQCDSCIRIRDIFEDMAHE